MTGIAAATPLRRRGRPVAVSLTAVLAVLASSCSGSGPSAAGPAGSPSAGGSSSARSAVAYSACMREHGVPTFPDPDSNGNVVKADPEQLRVSSSQLQAAQTACHDLFPTGGSLQAQTNCLGAGNCAPVLVQQMLTVEWKCARCMRNHGVPNWPDPTMDSQGMPVFNTTDAGIDRQFIHSSRFRSPNSVCQRLTGSAPVPRQ
jgi:hypothetical protein